MKTKIKNSAKLLVGMAIASAIAVVALLIESVLPIPIVGASVMALFIGIILNCIIKPNKLIVSGLKFTSKKILKLAIIFMGASLSIGMILTVGKLSLIVMTFTLLTCFGGGFIVGKLLKLNWKTSNLISAGTGICGGSAIAALSPVIEAKDSDIAIAMSATFIFDMIMIIIFPIMGRALGLSDMAFGLWAGTAVNDTSSVVATGQAFSDAACEFATMVKLTRTLSIIPVVIIFAFINIKMKQKEYKKTFSTECVATVDMQVEEQSKSDFDANQVEGQSKSDFDANQVEGQSKSDIDANQVEEQSKSGIDSATMQAKAPKLNLVKIIPWFILGFLGLAVANSIGLIPEFLSAFLKSASSFMMVASLASIGYNTNIKDIKSAGIRPMLHGFIISALVVVVAIGVQFMLGIV